jgi:uncharacterized lipoprotein YddW (UPF0748 family)
MLKKLRSILLFCLSLLLVIYEVRVSPAFARQGLSDPLAVNAKKPANIELRGVWLTNIDSEIFFNRDNLNKAIDRLAELNFNTIYPTVWNGGYTLFPSAVAKRTFGEEIDPDPRLQQRDILKETIDRAKQKKLAVIPWYEFGFMAPEASTLAQKYPQWLTQRADGSTVWLEGKVHPRVWLNPLHPEVQQFTTELILELVSDYDLDGIQLDDHFGYPSEFGYDDYTVELYQQEHDGNSPPTDYLDSDWIRWRADKITAYMEKLFRLIKLHNPKTIVSVSPNPQQFSLESFLLDWQTWERKGFIEELILQVYRTKNVDFLKEIVRPEVEAARKHIPVSIGILSGLKGRPMPLNTIRQQVKMSRDRAFAGVSFFFYESLWNFGSESVRERQQAFRSLFPHPVKRYTSSQKLDYKGENRDVGA